MTRLLTQGFQVWYMGQPLTNSQVFVFDNFTTTLSAIYEDAGLTVAAANPLTSDANGFVHCYLENDKLYTIAARTSSGSLVTVQNNVPGQATAVGGGTQGSSIFATYNGNARDMQPATPTGNGTTDGWHAVPLNGDNWVSYKSGTDINVGLWSEAVLFTGDDGAAGVSGTTTRLIYTRDSSQPAVPVGTSPSGWSADPSAPPAQIGEGWLWQSNGEFDSQGGQIGNWTTPVQIEGETGGQFWFQRSASQPVTPTTVNPGNEGWSDGPPGGTLPLWETFGIVSGDGQVLIQAWSTPTRHDGEDGLSYHQVYTRATSQPPAPTGNNPGDPWSENPDAAGGSGPLWMSSNQKDSGVVVGLWTPPVQIEGETGAAGDYYDFRYQRAASEPAQPPNVPEPAGWSDAPPSGSDILWQIIAKKDSAGNLLENWSDVEPVSGQNGISAYLTNPTISLTRAADGSVDVSLANGEFKVFEGTTDVTDSASFQELLQTNCNGQINQSVDDLFTGPKGAYRLTSITGATTTQWEYTMRATYGAAVFEAKFSGSVVNETVNVEAYISGGQIAAAVGNGTDIAIGSRTCIAQGINNPEFNWVRVSGATQVNVVDASSPTANFTSSGTNIERDSDWRCDVTADGGAGTTYQSNTIPVGAQHGTPP